MRTRRYRGVTRAQLAIGVASLFCAAVVSPTYAQEGPSPGPTGSAWATALSNTWSRGAATVAVITSQDQPTSVRFWSEFIEGAWVRDNRGLVQIVNLSKEREPALVRSLGINHFPTVVVYRRGPKGVTQVGRISDCTTAEDLAGGIRTLDLGLEPAGVPDSAVMRVAFGGNVFPSQQFETPAPQAPVASPPAPMVSVPPAMAPTQPAPTMSITPTMVQQPVLTTMPA